MTDFNLIYGTRDAQAEIVSLQTAKLNSKIDYDTEDDLLQIFLDASTEEIENYLDYPVIKRTGCTLKLKSWIYSFKFPFPVIDVTSLKYETGFESTQDIDSANWSFEHGELVLDMDEPEDLKGNLIVTLDVGYETANIPADIKAAALLMFTQADTYREDMQVKVNKASQHKLRPHKLAW